MQGTERERTVRIPAGPVTLGGDLTVPPGPQGVVLFAHGSGSSRHSPRNRRVARQLQEGRLATLLVDLLTADEEAADRRTAHLRFDIGLLAERLGVTADWLGRQPETRDLALGCFGASTGAAAALAAAAARPHTALAVVSRGGRPDLAGPALTVVAAPTLLIVGGDDTRVLELNRQAYERLRCEKRLMVIPRATHLFEEPGALDRVAHYARDWFEQHLVREAVGGAPGSKPRSARAGSPPA